MSISQTLKQKFSSAITDSHDRLGDETVFVDKKSIHEVLAFLKSNSDCPFDLLLDICGVDYLGEVLRFEVVYHLYSLAKKTRLRLRVKLAESDLKIATCMDLWAAADWFEREAFDMYGIHFEGHPNLKRLMMWEEFEGHPQRRDYPINKRQAVPESLDIV